METQDVVQMVPNLFMVKAGNHYLGSFLSIRGITSWMGGEPTVGFYVDDVYYRGFDTELLDVGRIEVLRGLQGTLYGRNTEAGVINIISQTPSTNEWQGKASFGMGNYNTQEYKGLISGPVKDDKLSFRIAAKHTFSDGYFNNTYLNDESADELDDFSGRASVLWTPDDDWDIQLNADVMRFRDGYASFNTLDQVHQNPMMYP